MYIFQTVADHRELLEEQLVYWDQVMSSREEVGSWAQKTVERLEDCTENFTDAVTVSAQLQTYKVCGFHSYLAAISIFHEK